MAYTKKTWKNNETKLSADNLNDIESGLEAAATKADQAAAQAAANSGTLNSHATAINNTNANLSSLADTVEDNAINFNSQVNGLSNMQAYLENELSNHTSNIGTNQDNIEDLQARHGALSSTVSGHANNKANPHSVTAAQTGAYTTTEIDQKLAIEGTETWSFYSNSTTSIREDYPSILNTIKPHPQKVSITLNAQSPLSFIGPNLMTLLDNGTTYAEKNTKFYTGLQCYNVGIDMSPFLQVDPMSPSSFIESGYSCEVLMNLTGYESSFETHFQSSFSNAGYLYLVNPSYLPSGMSENFAAAHFSNQYSDSDFNNTNIPVFVVLKNENLKKFFVVYLGYNYMDFESCCFYCSSKYLYFKAGFGGGMYRNAWDMKINLKDTFGEGTHFYSIATLPHSQMYAPRISPHVLRKPFISMSIYDYHSGSSVLPSVLLEDFHSTFDIFPPDSSISFELRTPPGFIFDTNDDSFEVQATFSYLKESSGNLVKLLDFKVDDEITKIQQIASLELKKLISTGVADPDATTPGLLYFKYLP